MTLQIEINRQDYSDFNKFNFVKTSLVKTIVVGLAACLLLQIFLNKERFHLFASIVSFLASIMAYSGLVYLQLIRTKKIPKDGGTTLGKRDMEFTNETIICKTKHSVSSSNWTAVRSLEKGKSAVYLYVDSNMAYIIPKRYFKNEQEQEDFIKFAETKIKTNAPAGARL